MHRCRYTYGNTDRKHLVQRTIVSGVIHRTFLLSKRGRRVVVDHKGLHVSCVLADGREPGQPGQVVCCREVHLPSNGDSAVHSLQAHEGGELENLSIASLDKDEAGDIAKEEQRQQGPPPCSFYIYEPESPRPVQLPPADASPEAAAVKPFFWRAKYKPPRFLQHYPCKAGAVYNYMSFLGPADPHEGKYFVSQQKQEAFLESYFNTLHHGRRRLHIAECYNDNPYKYFQELDFPWSLNISTVLALIPKVIQIVTQETCRVHKHKGPLPEPIICMRTPYKVHLSYPSIITVSAVAASLVRKAIINRCKVELSGQSGLLLLKEELQLQQQQQEAQQAMHHLQAVVQQLEAAGHARGSAIHKLFSESQPQHDGDQQQWLQQSAIAHQTPPAAVEQDFAVLGAAAGSSASNLVPGAADVDWESIIDFPHGSMRLVGSCKAPWMDSDPEWVTEKYYSRVQYVDGVWMRQPLTLATIQQCSILLSAMEQRLYEQSEDFLEASYQAVRAREQLLLAKSLLRRSNKYLGCLQKLHQALQDGNSEAAPVLFQEAYKHFLLAPPDVPSKRHQPLLAGSQPQRHSMHSRVDTQSSNDAAEQQRKKQEALERLKMLQGSAAAGKAAAVQRQGPKLIRPG